jgi:hypothetical protein
MNYFSCNNNSIKLHTIIHDGINKEKIYDSIDTVYINIDSDKKPHKYDPIIHIESLVFNVPKKTMKIELCADNITTNIYLKYNKDKQEYNIYYYESNGIIIDFLSEISSH